MAAPPFPVLVFLFSIVLISAAINPENVFADVISAAVSILFTESVERALMFVAQFVRVLTGIILLFMAFHLQFFADTDDSADEHCIPFHFRWPPFALAVLILDRSRAEPFIPFNDSMIVIVFCVPFIYLLWHGFFLVLEAYGGRNPKKQLRGVINGWSDHVYPAALDKADMSSDARRGADMDGDDESDRRE